jgi:hypothetical protein
MSDSEVKVPVPQGLQLFYAMYAVTLVLGIQDISDALYKGIKKFTAAEIDLSGLIVNCALFIGILLLIVRFFWSTGNIRRAWLRSKRGSDRVAPLFLVIHLPGLLFQGVLVLFLCFAYSDGAGSVPDARPVIFCFAVATAWNAIWLFALIRWEAHWPEKLWIANNAALVTGGALILLGLERDWVEELAALGIFAVLSILSSILDLWVAADSYLSDVGY